MVTPGVPEGNLLQFKALTIGTLDFGRIGFVGADGNALQPAVVGVLAVVCAVIDSALNALVGSTCAAAVGAILSHEKILLYEECWRFAVR